ncbi:hypothetical protein B4O97_03405 [Marispirochaeta aestuarii]|uniref:Uncharacterized protein n=1 Tax=Marispirochaeta aestuarii TaxID=1963862 RepID=A0A1Y1S180_9SPIO|nr:hypothetical protein [Marispirochaeta aestuarii]ORC37249.1 hypothetical protein B4O97_03405 [Marispirochaeta aestuarii]
MKKILFVLIFTLLLFFAFSQEQVFYNSHPTLEWNAIIEDADGNPFLPGDMIEYEVYGYPGSDIEVQPIENLTFFGITTATQMQIALYPRVPWYVALRYKHTDGGGNVTYSSLAYSTEEVPVTQDGPFGYFPWQEETDLKKIQGLRDSGM